MTQRPFALASVATGVLTLGTLATGATAWMVVGDLDESLSQASTSLDAVDQTLVVTETLLLDTATAFALVDGTFVNLSAATTSGTQSIEDAAALAADVPQNLREIQGALGQTQIAAATVDDVTRQLSSVPLVGSNIKATSLAPTITDLSLDLDPVIVDLEASSDSLGLLAEDARVLSDDLPLLREQLGILQADLATGASAIADLRASAFGTDAPGQATTLQTGLLKVLIILGTVSIAGTQFLLSQVLRRLGTGAAY